jgi:hypothetical protein
MMRTQKKHQGGCIADTTEATFTRLTYIALAHLHLSVEQAELIVFGVLLDLVDC